MTEKYRLDANDGIESVRAGPADERKIASLDGLRGVSIALVMLAHIRHTRGWPVILSSPLLDHGILGVRVFFVISGFLITRLIAQEVERTGSLSVRLFLIRRALRILPAFYVYFAFVAIATSLHWLEIPRSNLLAAASYSINYVVVNGRWETGHLWSLAVEEQFYLLWPWIICMLGMAYALRMAGLLAVTAPFGLLILFLRGSSHYMLATNTFPFVFDAIAAGCVLGGTWDTVRADTRVSRALSSRVGGLVPPAVLALDCLDHHSVAYHAGAQLAITIGICYAVARYVQRPDLPAARVLNSRPLSATGKLSYSLYLWQQPFLDPYYHTLLQTVPVNIPAAFGCAALSYHLVERPLNRFRRRYRADARRQLEAPQRPPLLLEPNAGAAGREA